MWIVGTGTAGNTLTPQFWIDTKRLVGVRIIAPLARRGRMLDARVGGYQRVGAAWLATHITVTLPGGASQDEVYTDWKVNPSLPAELFDSVKWHATPEWVRKAAKAAK